MHSIMDPTVGTFAGSIVELTDLLTEADLLTEDILIPTEDIPIPTEDSLIPTEDIPPASDNILVRFTVGITRHTSFDAVSDCRTIAIYECTAQVGGRPVACRAVLLLAWRSGYWPVCFSSSFTRSLFCSQS